MSHNKDFKFVATEGDEGSANPLQGQLKKMSGSVEVGFDLTNYTGTYTMWQVHWRGRLTSDPDSGSTGTITEEDASFIADEHNNRSVLIVSGRDIGSTYTIDDTSTATLTITADLDSAGIRDGDEYMIYSIKVTGSAVTIGNPSEGEFQYNWGSSDLDTVGSFLGEFRFSNTSTANTVLHFPLADSAREKIRITITKALDA